MNEQLDLFSVCQRWRSRRASYVVPDTRIDPRLFEVAAGLPARVRLHGFGVKSDSAMLACWRLASIDSMAWSSLGRRLEAKLRAGLGLPCDAPADQVLAATDAQLDALELDLLDFFEWKRAVSPKTAAASQPFAEDWRARQVAGLAATMVDRLLAADAPADPIASEQLDLFSEAA